MSKEGAFHILTAVICLCICIIPYLTIRTLRRYFSEPWLKEGEYIQKKSVKVEGTLGIEASGDLCQDIAWELIQVIPSVDSRADIVCLRRGGYKNCLHLVSANKKTAYLMKNLPIDRHHFQVKSPIVHRITISKSAAENLKNRPSFEPSSFEDILEVAGRDSVFNSVEGPFYLIEGKGNGETFFILRYKMNAGSNLVIRGKLQPVTEYRKELFDGKKSEYLIKAEIVQRDSSNPVFYGDGVIYATRKSYSRETFMRAVLSFLLTSILLGLTGVMYFYVLDRIRRGL